MVLLAWISADYDTALIIAWAKAQFKVEISRQAISQHRQKYAAEIEELRKTRHAEALTTGAALKEERVARLKRYLDELELKKWVTDDKGRAVYADTYLRTFIALRDELDPKRAVVAVGGDNAKVYIGVDLDKV